MPGGCGCCLWWKKRAEVPASPSLAAQKSEISVPPEEVAQAEGNRKPVAPVSNDLKSDAPNAADGDPVALESEPGADVLEGSNGIRHESAAGAAKKPPADGENGESGQQPGAARDVKVAVVQLVFDMEFEKVAEPMAQKEFAHGLRLGVSRALGIPLGSVEVGALRAGSVLADVILLSGVERDGAVVNAHTCAERLATSLTDPASEIRKVRLLFSVPAMHAH